jgi:hypothetical protein
VSNIIPFDMHHWFEPDTSPVENAYALRALLDCLIAVNQAYLKYNPRTPALYKSGVVYERVNEWMPIPALYRLGVGDCKSLACALIAEYRVKGIACEPAFRWIVRPGSDEVVRDFHILVEVAPGMKFEDPSKVLGMGADEVAPIKYVEDPDYFGTEARAKVNQNLRALKIL